MNNSRIVNGKRVRKAVFLDPAIYSNANELQEKLNIRPETFELSIRLAIKLQLIYGVEAGKR
jgi:hypothetical protein